MIRDALAMAGVTFAALALVILWPRRDRLEWRQAAVDLTAAAVCGILVGLICIAIAVIGLALRGA